MLCLSTIFMPILTIGLPGLPGFSGVEQRVCMRRRRAPGAAIRIKVVASPGCCCVLDLLLVSRTDLLVLWLLYTPYQKSKLLLPSTTTTQITRGIFSHNPFYQ